MKQVAQQVTNSDLVLWCLGAWPLGKNFSWKSEFPKSLEQSHSGAVLQRINQDRDKPKPSEYSQDRVQWMSRTYYSCNSESNFKSKATQNTFANAPFITGSRDERQPCEYQSRRAVKTSLTSRDVKGSTWKSTRCSTGITSMTLRTVLNNSGFTWWKMYYRWKNLNHLYRWKTETDHRGSV